MRMPRTPPTVTELLERLNLPRYISAIEPVNRLVPRSGYLHWDELVNRPCPLDLTHEEWWLGLKIGRRQLYKPIPLRDKSGRPFQFAIVEPIPEQLHHIDL